MTHFSEQVLNLVEEVGRHETNTYQKSLQEGPKKECL